jgi:iron complex outermembrane recepter protein
MRKLAVSGALYTGIAMGGSAVWAQAPSDALPEITVTAMKMGESKLQQTPLAVSALPADTLDRAHATDAHDLVQLVPSLQVAQTDAYAQIFLRGVGSNNVFNGSDPSVTVHVDGVYYARPFMQFADFLDVQRVEVLRGPQGTLYGRNSIGGTINIISRQPGDNVEASAAVGGGNFSTLDASGYLSGPILEGKLSASLAASHNEHDAYRDNIVPGGKGVDDSDSDAFRGQLRFTPFESITAITRADYASRDENIVGFSILQQPFNAMTNSILGDFDKVALNLPNRSAVNLWGVSQEVQVEFTDTLQLRSITAYRENSIGAQEDGDATDQSLTEVRLGERQHQFSEELNLVGKLARLDYLFGVFYFTEDAQTSSSVTLPAAGVFADFRPETNTDSVGIFTQGTYHFSDQWAFTAGARYSDEDKDFGQRITRFRIATGAVVGAPVVYSGTRSFNSVTPKASLSWAPTADIMLYVSATRGFKSGGFNFNSANPSQGFNPETLWSYEVGAKTQWLERRVQANFTGFHYDYKDLQVSSFITAGQTDITNAATAKVDGIELELLAMPIQPLRLSANVTWLDAKYDSYPNAPVPGGVLNASGNRLNYSPKYSGSARGEYTFKLANGGGAYIGADYSWYDDAFYTAANNPIVGQEAYGVVNAALGYRSPDARWTAEVYGRNLGDEDYLTNVYTASVVPAGIPGAPRTYGVSLRWTY